MIAPAAQGNGIPIPAATPIKASPTVPAVPQDVPVTRDVSAHSIKLIGKKNIGVIIFKP
ncbi:hypothetical protein ES705_48212 [subsurface metagenome]